MSAAQAARRCVHSHAAAAVAGQSEWPADGRKCQANGRKWQDTIETDKKACVRLELTKSGRQSVAL